MRCLAISSNSMLNIEDLQIELAKTKKVTRYRRVLHTNSDGDIFYFPYGVIVCWGMEKHDESSLMALLENYAGNPFGTTARDTHEYEYGDVAKVVHDTMTLPDKKVKTKLAFSHALAQSVKLMGLESLVSKTSEQTREIPQTLALKGKISLSRKKIRRLMGELLLNKSAVNLHLELLNTPKFFWHNPELVPYYEAATEYIDLDQRVESLNQRIEVMHDVFEMLTAELHNQHSTFLEWIVITLISFEVVLSLLHGFTG